MSTQGYSPDYLEAVGADGEGSYVPLAHALLEEADEIPALAEYIEWLEKVAPDAEPSSNGLQRLDASAKLFVEAAEAVGEDLTRDKLMAELESITDWDADGLIPPDRHRRARSGDGVLRHGPGEGRRLRAGLPRRAASTARPTTSTSTRPATDLNAE